MHPEKLLIAIVGCGSIGKRHAKNLMACGVQKIDGIDPDTDRQREMQTITGGKAFASLEAGLEQKSYDAVFITSPTAYHAADALRAAEAGSHLFVEKPLSHTLEGLEKLLDIVHRKKLKGHVSSNWKFYPSFVKIKELLENQRIGKLLSTRCEAGQYLPDWHPWEDYRKGYSARKTLGGGILLDCHEFDYLTWFAGKPERIACLAGKTSSLEIDTEDVAEVILRFKSGAIGEIHVDYVQRAYQRSYEFFGEEGTILWDFTSKKVRLYLAHEKRWQEWPEPEDYDFNQMHLDQTRHFLNVIEGLEEPMTPLDRGHEVLSWILAAKSAAQQQRVMTV